MPAQRSALRPLRDREQRRALDLVEQLLELAGGKARAPEKKPPPTMQQVYARWLERRELRGLRNTHNERAQLERHVLPAIGKMRLDEIRVRHMRDLIEKLSVSGLAPRTVRSIYGTVHKLFADLVVDEVLASTPCVLTKDQLPKLRDKDPDWRAGALFSRQELELLISAEQVPEDRRVCNAITFLGGLRFGELAGLRWYDLDDTTEPLWRLSVARSYWHSTKTDTPRLVPVHPVLAKILRDWREIGFAELMGRKPEPHDLVVPSRRGFMRSRHQHRNKFLQDLARLDLRPRRVHDTRRTFITLARVDGARREVLEQITHAPKRSVMDLYTTLPWPTLCQAVSCIRVRRLSANDVRWRLASMREAREKSGQPPTGKDE